MDIMVGDRGNFEGLSGENCAHLLATRIGLLVGFGGSWQSDSLLPDQSR